MSVKAVTVPILSTDVSNSAVVVPILSTYAMSIYKYSLICSMAVPMLFIDVSKSSDSTYPVYRCQ